MSLVFVENGADKVHATALFNRLNGLFVSVSSVPLEQSQHDTSLYEARAVEFSFLNDYIEGQLIVNDNGTYTDAFEVKDKTEQKEQVFERMLNMQAEQKITKKYPLVTQLNLLVAAVNRLAKEHGLESTEEFVELAEMVSYIDQVIETNQAKKEFYANNPDVEYYSDERVAEEESARMEGGIHEALGPRAVTGGSVFGSDV